MATLIQPAELTFVDANGAPLAGGTVSWFIPGTTTPKAVWLDAGETQSQQNPTPLDLAGRCIAYGNGGYRQVVQDSVGNTIWDQPTAANSAQFTQVVITASETYVVQAGVTSIKARGCGGGGGGAGSPASGAAWSGSGGGAGGYFEGAMTVIPGSSISVVIGAPGAGGVSNTVGSTGGTTSFGSFSATGGTPGVPDGGGGLGGVASGALINMTGGAGGNGATTGDTAGLQDSGGYGGSGPLGAGGPASVVGLAGGQGWGSGGGGAYNENSLTGGDGASGVAILEYWINV